MLACDTQNIALTVLYLLKERLLAKTLSWCFVVFRAETRQHRTLTSHVNHSHRDTATSVAFKSKN